MNRIQGIRRMLLVFCLTAGLLSCEDDPILEGPSNGQAGGSYGRLGLPDSTGRYTSPSVPNHDNPAVF